MLDAQSFRIAWELELLASIRANPASDVVCAAVQQEQRTAADAARSDAQLLSRTEHGEIWSAVEHALAIFGLAGEFILTATGTPDETYCGITFRADGGRLSVEASRAILQRLAGSELAGAVGHGLGHFLLGHDSDPGLAPLLALARAEVGDGEGRADELWDDPRCAGVLGAGAALAQVQELSADRIGLVVARDLDATLLAAVHQFSDVVAHPWYLRRALRHAVPAAAWPESALRPHPSFPNRVFLLELFSESALYRGLSGATGGLTAAEELQRSAPFLPLSQRGPDRASNHPDDLLLELILMDSLVAAGRQPRPRAERMILRYLPPGRYDELMAHYDAIADDDDGRTDPLRFWLRRAARKKPEWKIAMIERFLYLVSLDARIGDEALGEVATLSAAMGASEECGLIYTQGFGYDPFRWLNAEADQLLLPWPWRALPLI